MKESTSQVREAPFPSTWHMARSLSWEYCSGTNSSRRWAGDAPSRSSNSLRISCPARAYNRVSKVSHSFLSFFLFYHTQYHKKTTHPAGMGG